MCLIRIEERYDPPLAEVEAWKVFAKDSLSGQISSPYFSHFDEAPFERHYYREGVWEDAGKQKPVLVTTATQDGPFGRTVIHTTQYPSGFHAFAAEEDAQREAKGVQAYFFDPLVVRKVRLRGVHTKGVDGLGPSPVYVAQEMLLLPESGEGENGNGV